MAEQPETVLSNEEVPVETPVQVVPEPTPEPDYKALAEAEKARADAAEALIIKNKSITKRNDEPSALTEERVLELIRTAKDDSDESPEAKALADAQAKVKTLQSEKDELLRAQKGKDGTSSNPASTHRDPLPEVAPKLAPGSPLAGFQHLGNGLYSKKLATGKTMFKNTQAQGNERKSWVE